MAAVATTSRTLPIDTSTTAPHTLQLGKTARNGTTANPFITVRYNHKPSIKATDDTTTSIVPSSGKGPGISILSLKDGDDEYEYRGRSVPDDHTYILIRENGKDGFVLERLDALHKYNLRTASTQADPLKLAEQYPPLDSDDDGSDDKGYSDTGKDGASGNDEEPDSDNPFDFRHYLDAPPSQGLAATPSGTHPQLLSPGYQASAQGTPTFRASKKQTSAVFSQPRKAKPERAVVDKTNSGEKANGNGPHGKSTNGDIPKVRVDNPRTNAPLKKQHKRKTRADVEDINLDDSGDLVLEGDMSQKASVSYGKRSLGLALAGQLGDGPKSLRSAANSPGSRITSPMPARSGSYRADDGDIVMGDDSTPHHHQQTRRRPTDDDDDNDDDDADADGDVDDDVDDLQLPSPAQVHRPSVSDQVVTAVDDEDDLEQQMLMAMEADDDDDGPAQGSDAARNAGNTQESDEESEEE